MSEHIYIYIYNNLDFIDVLHIFRIFSMFSCAPDTPVNNTRAMQTESNVNGVIISIKEASQG